MQREGSVLPERISASWQAISDLPFPVGAVHRRTALQHHQQDQPDRLRCVCARVCVRGLRYKCKPTKQSYVAGVVFLVWFFSDGDLKDKMNFFINRPLIVNIFVFLCDFLTVNRHQFGLERGKKLPLLPFPHPSMLCRRGAPSRCRRSWNFIRDLQHLESEGDEAAGRI